VIVVAHAGDDGHARDDGGVCGGEGTRLEESPSKGTCTTGKGVEQIWIMGWQQWKGVSA
jgi:hypothetical protein